MNIWRSLAEWALFAISLAVVGFIFWVCGLQFYPEMTYLQGLGTAGIVFGIKTAATLTDTYLN